MARAMNDSLEDRVLKLVLLGPPGGGKGTQARMLHVRYGIAHVSTGDIFRVEIALRTERGMASKPYLAEGSLVPDGITNQLIEECVASEECSRGYVLDGYPRTVGQARYLESLGGITVALDLIVDRKACEKRLLARGRKDDTPEIISHRFDIYEEETEPIREYYRSLRKLALVDGNGEVEEVAVRLWQAVADAVARRTSLQP